MKRLMRMVVPVLVAMILLHAGTEKKGSFDLTANGGGGGGGGTGDVVIIG